ncbi:YggS family pyridoxal phosphate-dependent enzyme [Aestuariibacter halophilus]|uniref:Pyridoxal phosphate homeostasis protein n=1 Tax=Fluctibacter halophilus TaxID=226011 RepID=A0ABS8GBQ7_9ALTE|nr:YggS family pyridoxal phosphate-dependent enzyme [Aestuariibacter halophilus]MCC2618025.1 YggS family pyridoxal phosphate-dependent enzyme [Aestuariibacter halophilus]
METIAERLKSALLSLQQSAVDAHRAPNSVQLLAVSKTKPVSDIVLAYEAGQRKFGENYVQEGVEKVQQLQDFKDIEWHFIGPLQSNKTRLVAEHFDWVQSIDRVKIARRLSEQRSPFKPLNVLIQVNINDEDSKSGVAPTEIAALAADIDALPNLILRGLMTIPAAAQSEQQLQQSFAHMHQAFTDLKASYPQVDTLSMGMSGDMEQAIKAGSTMVRLGTALFGPRARP